MEQKKRGVKSWLSNQPNTEELLFRANTMVENINYIVAELEGSIGKSPLETRKAKTLQGKLNDFYTLEQLK